MLQKSSVVKPSEQRRCHRLPRCAVFRLPRPRPQKIVCLAKENDTEFKALLKNLQALPTSKLRAAAAARPAATSTAFLAWLGDKSRPAPDGREDAAAKDVARVAEVLVSLRDWQEESARRQLLPALAASVAYDNLHRWKVEEYGGHNWQVPVEVGFGAEGKLDVDIEKLYRAAEKEEQKLTGKSAQARSTIDSFASKAGNEVYASIAATAMARARARLLGFDSGTSAVAAVLDALLALDGGRGERAMALDEACTAPGIVIPAQASPFSESATQANNAAAANPTRPDASGIQNRSARTSAPDPLADRTRSLGAYGRRSQASSQRSATGAPPAAQQARAVTNPKALRDEIDKRLLQLSGASGDRDQGHSVPHGLPEVLPTGELLAEVLKELLEDAAEYEERVWVQRPPQERVQ